jgi:predicted phage replisome organizer
MDDVKWIKITTNIFDDEKIMLIDSLPDRDAVMVIWLKILTLAGKCNNNGLLTMNDKIAYTDEMLSTIFRRPLNTVRLALETFEDFEMIEIQDNFIMISNWEKHQNIDGLAKIRDQRRKRVKKFRNKQELITSGVTNEITNKCTSNVTSNVTVTLGNAIELDLDLEGERDKDNNKDIEPKETKKNFVSVINDFNSNIELQKALTEYVDMRKKTKGFTVRALELNLSALTSLNYDDANMINVVNHAIMKTWKSFYPLPNLPKSSVLPAYKTKKKEMHIMTAEEIKESEVVSKQIAENLRIMEQNRLKKEEENMPEKKTLWWETKEEDIPGMGN